jgi:hypothetical protein
VNLRVSVTSTGVVDNERVTGNVIFELLVTHPK